MSAHNSNARDAAANAQQEVEEISKRHWSIDLTLKLARYSRPLGSLRDIFATIGTDADVNLTITRRIQ